MIYDVEVFPNLFSCVFKNVLDGNHYHYYFFSGDPWPSMSGGVYERIRNNYCLIGYNNLSYDSYILHSVFESFRRKRDTKQAIDEIYKLSERLISKKEKTNIKERRTECRAEIDLLKLLRIFKSLKWCAFQLGLEIKEEFYEAFGKDFPRTKLADLYKYNLNDVNVTQAVYEYALNDIELRGKLFSENPDLGKTILSVDNSGLGSSYLALKMGVSNPYINGRDSGADQLDIYRDVIFDWVKSYSFKHDNLKRKYKQLSSTTLTYSRSNPSEWKATDAALKSSCLFDNNEMVFGAAGLHYSKTNFKFEKDKEEKYRFLSIDVVSYYPSLIYKNGLIPRKCPHSFLPTYGEFLELRKSLPKDSIERYAIKIALNSVFGKTRSLGSIFCDQRCFLQVTLNGQLFMAQMVDAIHDMGASVILANTDGIFIKIQEDRVVDLEALIKREEARSGLEFEITESNKIFVRDVNNFLSDKYGAKGCFSTDINYLGGNRSNIASRIAAREYLLNKIPIQDTLYDLWIDDDKKHYFQLGLYKSPKIKKIHFLDKEFQTKVYVYYNTLLGNPLKIEYLSGRAALQHRNNLSSPAFSINEMQAEPNFKYYADEAKSITSPFEVGFVGSLF